MNPNLAPELPRLWQGPQDIPCQIPRISYHMLKYKQEYQDPGRNFYEQQYRERVIKNLKRKAKALGME